VVPGLSNARPHGAHGQDHDLPHLRRQRGVLLFDSLEVQGAAADDGALQRWVEGADEAAVTGLAGESGPVASRDNRFGHAVVELLLGSGQCRAFCERRLPPSASPELGMRRSFQGGIQVRVR
jgi:hypothetical protein